MFLKRYFLIFLCIYSTLKPEKKVNVNFYFHSFFVAPEKGLKRSLCCL